MSGFSSDEVFSAYILGMSSFSLLFGEIHMLPETKVVADLLVTYEISITAISKVF
jgi:hypothetical protein